MPSHIVTLTTRNTRLIDKMDHLLNKKLIIHSSEMILKHCKIKSYIEELTLARGNKVTTSAHHSTTIRYSNSAASNLHK